MKPAAVNPPANQNPTPPVEGFASIGELTRRIVDRIQKPETKTGSR